MAKERETSLEEKASKKEKKRKEKALKVVSEINKILDKMIINKEVTNPLSTKSTQLKPFKSK